MPTSTAAAEMYTTVENTSGSARTFGYLGPRGMRLDAGEVVTVRGDLIANLGVLTQLGGKNRKFDSLERSLAAGTIRINSRPAPVLFDDVDEVPKSLAISNGALGIVDPTYNAESSAHFEEVG